MFDQDPLSAEINGETVTFEITVNAVMALNRFGGGLAPLERKLAALDIEAIVEMLYQTAQGKPSKKAITDYVVGDLQGALGLSGKIYGRLFTGGKQSEPSAEGNASP
ncbi:MAG: hypothetical protein ACPGOY_04715 [Rhodospirillaceae bacterium]